MVEKEKAKREEKAVAAICILLLFVSLAGVLYSVITKQMDKASEQTFLNVNWKGLYPFSDPETEADAKSKGESNPLLAKISLWEKFVSTKKAHFQKYHTTLLPGYQTMAEWAQKYNSVVRWNYTSYDEYNGVVDKGEGYLVGRAARVDVGEHIDSVLDYQRKCEQAGMRFLYVATPSKVCRLEDADYSGSVDFCNQNADDLLSGIRDAGVAVLDLREKLHEQGLNHHAMFYNTDHHWKTTAGLWAAGEILDCCNQLFGAGADLSLLELSAFRQQLYEKWFLGSQGKKVTLARAVPDDFTLLYPNYETSVHFTVPTRGIDAIGSFEIMYDMYEVTNRDYYTKNPYGACAYGETALCTVENLKMPEGKKVLLIRDSMSDCVIPCLSMGFGQLHSLDLRLFNGSVWEYTRSYDPDIVIVMYGASSIGSISWNNHVDKFDFR